MKLGKSARAAGAGEDEDQRHQRPVQQAAPSAWAFIRGRPATCFPACRIQKGADHHGGISMDQVLANRIGQDTAQPSMVLACEQPMTGYHETNFSMAYSSHISWQSADFAGAQRSLSVAGVRQPVRKPRQPAQPEHPGPGRKIAPRASAARSVRSDKAKLDEYLTSVREVEKRIERMRSDKDKADDTAPRATGSRCSRWSGRTTGCPKTFASTPG